MLWLATLRVRLEDGPKPLSTTRRRNKDTEEGRSRQEPEVVRRRCRWVLSVVIAEEEEEGEEGEEVALIQVMRSSMKCMRCCKTIARRRRSMQVIG